MMGYHPRTLGWARLRLRLAAYRLIRETGVEAFLIAVCDALAAFLTRWFPPR